MVSNMSGCHGFWFLILVEVGEKLGEVRRKTGEAARAGVGS